MLDFIIDIIDWGIFFMEDALFNLIKTLIEQNKVGLKNVPIVTFNDLIVDIGVNRRGDVIEAFNLIVSGGRAKLIRKSQWYVEVVKKLLKQ
ncbi:MAG: hypothetical protein ABIM42_05895 [candidate division WOR-3 bacterium]